MRLPLRNKASNRLNKARTRTRTDMISSTTKSRLLSRYHYHRPRACNFENVGSGAVAGSAGVSYENIEGKAAERLVMTKETVRSRRLFLSPNPASLGRGSRN